MEFYSCARCRDTGTENFHDGGGIFLEHVEVRYRYDPGARGVRIPLCAECQHRTDQAVTLHDGAETDTQRHLAVERVDDLAGDLCMDVVTKATGTITDAH